MITRGMLKGLCLNLLLVGGVSTYAETVDRSQWTANQFWEETQLSFSSLIYGVINDANCKSSHQKILACIAVMNEMHDMQNPKNDETIVIDLKDGLAFKKIPTSGISTKDYLIKLKKELSESEIDESGLGMLRGSFSDSLTQFDQNFLNESNDSLTAANLYNVFLRVAVDPHSYIMPSYFNQQRSQAVSNKKGLGLSFQVVDIEGKEKYEIIDLDEGAPGEKAGFKVGDVILQVNGVDTLKEMLSVMKTVDELEITVLRESEVLNFMVTRAEYEIRNVIAKYFSVDGGIIGYIKLRSFSDPTGCSAIKKTIDFLNSKFPLKGMILDLRNNGGGLVSQATCIMENYLELGSINWMTKTLGDNELVYQNFTTDNFVQRLQRKHNVVLVNGYSASASEALSMFLQDYQKAWIVGERTFGKGSMQGVGGFLRSEFGENAQAILTAETKALYYGPKGISPQVDGVEPDIKAYPRIDQFEETEFVREEDRYAFPILDRVVNKELLVDPERELEKAKIQGCVNEQRHVRSKFDKLSTVDQKSFDNQLEVAIETVLCASEHAKVKARVELNQTNDIEMISIAKKRRRIFREQNRNFRPEPIKPEPIQFEPFKPEPIQFELKPQVKPQEEEKPENDGDDTQDKE